MIGVAKQGGNRATTLFHYPMNIAPSSHGFRCLLWDQVGDYWVTGEWDANYLIWITDPNTFSQIQATRWMPLPEKPE